MHYKNGRHALQGDVALCLTYPRITGVIHSVTAGSTSCNAQLRPQGGHDVCVTLSDCLHFDDIAKAVLAGTIPDTTVQGVPSSEVMPQAV